MIHAQLSFYTDLRRELRSIILLLANDFNTLQHLTWSLLTTIVNSVLLKKLIVAHLVKNIRSLCSTPRSINCFRNSPSVDHFFICHSNISPIYVSLPSQLFSLWFPTTALAYKHFLYHPYVLHDIESSSSILSVQYSEITTIHNSLVIMIFLTKLWVFVSCWVIVLYNVTFFRRYGHPYFLHPGD